MDRPNNSPSQKEQCCPQFLPGAKSLPSALSLALNLARDLLHPEAPAVDLIPSSRTQWNAQYSPDGKRIVFASLRSGSGVWISDDDGSDLVQISNPQDESGSPHWSPDGNRIVFDSRPGPLGNICGRHSRKEARKLVTNISDLIRPHWSRDGKWIYFRSEEPGRFGIYRCPASGGDAVLLSRDIDGYNPQESFDGKTVYFASPVDKSTLRRVPLSAQPGTKSVLDGLPRMRNCSVLEISPRRYLFCF